MLIEFSYVGSCQLGFKLFLVALLLFVLSCFIFLCLLALYNAIGADFTSDATAQCTYFANTRLADILPTGWQPKIFLPAGENNPAKGRKICPEFTDFLSFSGHSDGKISGQKNR